MNKHSDTIPTEANALYSFQKMKEESKRFKNLVQIRLSDLFKIYNRDFAIFAFGSPNRNEMLPESDVDVIVINPVSLIGEEVRARILSILNTLPYDKIDIPPWRSLINIQRFSSAASPESRYGDSKFIAGDPHLKVCYDRLDIKANYINQEELQTRLLFHHYFLDYWYSSKVTKHGINLKYSKGATRDIIYFDWFLDYRLGTKARNDDNPQIVTCLDYFSHLNKFEISLDLLRFSIEYVSYIKYRALELNKGTNEEGKGFMNISLAIRLLENDKEKVYNQLSIYSAQQLIDLYNKSREQIYKARLLVFNYVEKDLIDQNGNGWSKLYHDIKSNRLTLQHCKIILKSRDVNLLVTALWIATKKNIKQQVDYLSLGALSSGNWSALASALSSPILDTDIIHNIIIEFAEKAGFEYLTRLAIKNPNTGLDTLRYMVALPRLAMSDDIDLRYRQEIMTLINKNEHSRQINNTRQET